MLDWLKKLATTNRASHERAPLHEPGRLDSEAIDLMAIDFAKLNRLQPGISHRLLRDVSTTRAKRRSRTWRRRLRAAGHALDLLMLNYKVRANDHGKMFATMQNAAASLAPRLAKVYAAAGKADGMTTSQSLCLLDLMGILSWYSRPCSSGPMSIRPNLCSARGSTPFCWKSCWCWRSSS